MKEDNQGKKDNNENHYFDYINNVIASPKQKEKDPFFNLALSPENSMNQKFFPSKENYFGIKTSPINNIGRSISPNTHSPILEYYAGLNPNGDNFGFYSPKNENNNVNTSNDYSRKLSPNFNYSPTNIFNKKQSSGDLKSNMQNFSLNNNLNNNEDDSKTLQEKMALFVGPTDVNNFIKDNSFPSGSLGDNKKEHQEDSSNEDDSDDNEEAFILKFDNFDDDYEAQKRKSGQSQSSENIQKNGSNDNKVNNNLKVNNLNDRINQNNNLPTPFNIQENKNKDISDISEDKSLVKNIINKQNFKPYIPNKYRNKQQNINNIQNTFEGHVFPSYEGTNPVIDSNNYDDGDIQNMNPEKIGQYLNYNNNDKNNKFSLNNKNNYNINMPQNDYENENLYNNFYYNGDNYKISNFKEYKKKII